MGMESGAVKNLRQSDAVCFLELVFGLTMWRTLGP